MNTFKAVAYECICSLGEQKRALIRALNYANVNGRKLQIPSVYWNHEPVDFCLAFEIKDVRIHNILVARKKHALCSENRASDEHVQHACLSFGYLVRQTVDGFGVFNLSSVLVCDPTNKDYTSLHQCHTKRVADNVTR